MKLIINNKIRLFVTILILIISLQPWSKANGIKEFEIDGMTVGDSLLDFYSIEEIKLEIKEAVYYPKSKKMMVVGFQSKKSNLYAKYDFHIKNNDKKYIIYSVKGLVKLPIDKCLEQKKEVISEIENQINNTNRNDYKGDYGYDYGNSIAHVSDFDFENGDSIRVWCMEWDSNNENVKANLYWDGLAVNISLKEQVDFIQYEAY